MKPRNEASNIEAMNSIRLFWTTINRRPLLTDTILTFALVGLAILSLFSGWEPGQRVSYIMAVFLTVVLITPLILRRYVPLAVLIFMMVVEICYRFLLIPEPTFTAYALLFAVASAAAFGSGQRRTWVIGAFILIEMIAIMVLAIVYPESGWLKDTPLAQFLTYLSNLFLFGAAWWVGELFRSRREREADLKERTEQLKIEREENAQRAVLDERVRIARELHDVVAHHVSVMGIQAGAARKVLNKQPDKVNEALSTIEASSRQAISELHRLLGFLRPKNQVEGVSPQPSLKYLDTLVNAIRNSGLPVEIRIIGKEQTIPESIDVSAYRIIQEALTNVLKHAGPAKATVTLKYLHDMIELDISDNGKGEITDSEKKPGRRGIIGMKERVNLHGGELETGNKPDGGFFVRVKLPLDRDRV
jgi:signal transduction histidine kinase